MIRLDVRHYCHKCPYFEAEVEKPIQAMSMEDYEEYIIGDFIITCVNKNLCERVRNIKN